MMQSQPRPQAERFISFDQVSKTYNARHGLATALLDTSLLLQQGEFVCVVGPSGCGKTTLLNMLAGFVTPSTGRITVESVPVDGPGPERGVVFQEVGLFPWLTVLANVEFGLRMSGVGRRERRERAYAALSLTKMEQFGERYPNELSGGMKQRVGLARVLANNPQVLLMDEPFGALDALTRRMMQDELLRVWGETRKTVLFITHSVDEALLLGDRVVVMTAAPGRIKADIRIALDRPRDENSIAFNDLEKSIKEMVLAEARVTAIAQATA
jgi:ABC-type nitrate/sulfonate/bicarbonate transport system ATPase subunit